LYQSIQAILLFITNLFYI